MFHCHILEHEDIRQDCVTPSCEIPAAGGAARRAWSALIL